MTTKLRERNRGPAAAEGNRRAILAAARRLFASRGYRVPLSAIAREAGVGQGVLYRHFPTRLDLAFAVFDENFVDLESIASEPDPGAPGRLWKRLLEHTIEHAAFVEMVLDARQSLPDYVGDTRLRRLVEQSLERAKRAGRVMPEVTPDDVLLAQRMAYGVVTTAGDGEPVEDAVRRAMALLAPWTVESTSGPRLPGVR